MSSFELNYLFKDPISQYSHILNSGGVKTSTYETSGDTVQLMTLSSRAQLEERGHEPVGAQSSSLGLQSENAGTSCSLYLLDSHAYLMPLR